jgi:hypothetical protein
MLDPALHLLVVAADVIAVLRVAIGRANSSEPSPDRLSDATNVKPTERRTPWFDDFSIWLQVIAILPFACTTAFAQNADTLTNAIGQALGTFVNGGSNTNPSNVPPNPSSAYGNVPPANSSGGGTGSSRTHHEKGIPHGIPHAAVAASAKARKWNTDAQLVMVDVDRNGPGGATETRFSFYSALDRRGCVGERGPAYACRLSELADPADIGEFCRSSGGRLPGAGDGVAGAD